MPINRCDCCGQFGELETVTVEVKKHKECDINTLFGKSTTTSPFNAPSIQDVPDKPIKLGAPFQSIPKVIEHDMPPIPQDFIDKTIKQ